MRCNLTQTEMYSEAIWTVHRHVADATQLVNCSTAKGQQFLRRQESWAIANTTERLAQYMGAPKNFESPDYAHGYFSRNL